MVAVAGVMVIGTGAVSAVAAEPTPPVPEVTAEQPLAEPDPGSVPDPDAGVGATDPAEVTEPGPIDEGETVLPDPAGPDGDVVAESPAPEPGAAPPQAPAPAADTDLGLAPAAVAESASLDLLVAAGAPTVVDYRSALPASGQDEWAGQQSASYTANGGTVGGPWPTGRCATSRPRTSWARTCSR
ncbi:hypothetical protein Cde04nite_35030 [Cellulomonas denverensis]|nr:hypothetical protein Cde04nite_35030 [Cellulomonas denverensis]